MLCKIKNSSSVKYLNSIAFKWLKVHLLVGNIGLLLLVVISSVIYIIFFVQPTTTMFIDYVVDNRTETLSLTNNKLSEEKINILTHNEKLLMEENINKCRDENKNVVILLKNEKETLRQTKESLIEQLQLLKEKRKQEKDHIDFLSEKIANQKEILEAYTRANQEFFEYSSVILRNTSYPGVENYTRYAVARLGLLPLINVEPLKPEFGPVINDVLSFRYPITIRPCLDVKPSVFIAVVSAPGNFEKRRIIRQTWQIHLKAASHKGLLNIAGFGFMLGLTTNLTHQAQIEEESKTYGDIIQIGMSDFYRNLSLKVAGIFNWLYRNCSKVDFIFKVDDDVYVNVNNLVHFVQSYHHQSNGSMFGLPADSYYSNRVGKWSITYEEWPWRQYPKYYLGPAVLIHGNAILLLLAAFQTTPMMPFDDVYYSGICREKADIKLHFFSKSFGVFIMRQPEFPLACDLRHFIAWLTVSGNQMNNSHIATDDFYHNRTQCIITDSNGINTTIDHNEPVQFYFN